MLYLWILFKNKMALATKFMLGIWILPFYLTKKCMEWIWEEYLKPIFDFLDNLETFHEVLHNKIKHVDDITRYCIDDVKLRGNLVIYKTYNPNIRPYYYERFKNKDNARFAFATLMVLLNQSKTNAIANSVKAQEE